MTGRLFREFSIVVSGSVIISFCRTDLYADAGYQAADKERETKAGSTVRPNRSLKG